MTKYKLKDICVVNQGLQIPISERFLEPGENRYFYITIQFLKKNEEKTYYIESPNQNVICTKEDILVVRTGSTGLVLTDIEGCFHNNFFKVTPNKSLVLPRYLYYFLNSPKTYRKMRQLAGITVIPDLSHGAFYSIEIDLPNLDVQKNIVEILDLYSSKIDSNNELLENLSEYSQLLFHKWFIDYNFPDVNGYSYKASGGEMVEVDGRIIPIGWRFEPLGKYITFEKGISYKSDEIVEFGNGKPMLNLNSFKREGGYKPEGIKFYTGNYKDSNILRPFELVVACTDVTRNADIIGSPVIIPDIHGETLLASCDVAKINIIEPLNQYYLSCVLKQNAYKKYIKGFANGTNVLHLDVKGISKFYANIPNKYVLDKFTEIMKIIELKKSALIKENKSLEEMRNLLINKLIK